MAGAHRDSVGDGPGAQRRRQRRRGAVRGVAEALTAGARRDDRFGSAFWGAEELGLVGSRRYVRRCRARAAAIRRYLNLDMVGSEGRGAASRLRQPARRSAAAATGSARPRRRPRLSGGTPGLGPTTRRSWPPASASPASSPASTAATTSAATTWTTSTRDLAADIAAATGSGAAAAPAPLGGQRALDPALVAALDLLLPDRRLGLEAVDDRAGAGERLAAVRRRRRRRSRSARSAARVPMRCSTATAHSPWRSASSAAIARSTRLRHLGVGLVLEALDLAGDALEADDRAGARVAHERRQRARRRAARR